jgi:pentatricopeptide repeat protein
MNAIGIKPTVVTYTALMKACNNCKQWQQAVDVYEQLEQDPSVEADKIAYQQAIRAYKHVGNIDKVAELTAAMQQLIAKQQQQ